MAPEKVETITKLKTLKIMEHVQSASGFANFYRQFIEAYARVTLPLTDLTCKDSP